MPVPMIAILAISFGVAILRYARLYYSPPDGGIDFHGDRPGYYDDWGRSLDPVPWEGPLARMQVTSPFASRRCFW